MNIWFLLLFLWLNAFQTVYQRVFQLISTAIPLLCIWRIQSATELCITLELQDHRIDISPAFDQPNSLLSRVMCNCKCSLRLRLKFGVRRTLWKCYQSKQLVRSGPLVLWQTLGRREYEGPYQVGQRREERLSSGLVFGRPLGQYVWVVMMCKVQVIWKALDTINHRWSSTILYFPRWITRQIS